MFEALPHTPSMETTPTYGTHLRWGGFHVRRPSAHAKHRNHPRWGGFRVRCLFAHTEHDVGCVSLFPSITTHIGVVFVFDAFPHTPSTETSYGCVFVFAALLRTRAHVEHENHPNMVRHPSTHAEQKSPTFLCSSNFNVTSI